MGKRQEIGKVGYRIDSNIVGINERCPSKIIIL